MPNYDDWKTALPDDKQPNVICDDCGRYLYEGDAVYLIGKDNLCKKCMEDRYRRIL